MLDMEQQREHFENHVATFTDYGNIKILDFKNPKSSDYRIRFLFEEDYCRLHISGDLGELIATNYNNMTYGKFSDFTNDIGYFEGKINCHSRDLYRYEEDVAKEELRKYISENDLEEALTSGRYAYYEKLDDVIDDIMSDFDCDKGISQYGIEQLSAVTSDSYELYSFTSKLGKTETGILQLYMLAFELAQKSLAEQEG